MSRSRVCVVATPFTTLAADGITPGLRESIDSLQCIEVDTRAILGAPAPMAWDDDDDEDDEFVDDDDEDLDLGDEDDEDFFDDEDEEGVDDDEEDVLEDE